MSSSSSLLADGVARAAAGEEIGGSKLAMEKLETGAVPGATNWALRGGEKRQGEVTSTREKALGRR